MLAGLEVRTERMRKNLDMTQGLIVAEAVMMGLAPALGRQVAHDVVYAACRLANDQGTSLLDALLAQGEATAQLDLAELQRLTDPANYLGLAPQMVDIALAREGAVPR
jgi:3-carboxy-cis,cis-muconate cycloisomerase